MILRIFFGLTVSTAGPALPSLESRFYVVLTGIFMTPIIQHQQE